MQVLSNPIKILNAPKLTSTVDFVIGGNAPVDPECTKPKVPSGNAFLKKVNVPKLKSISGKITINNNAALKKVIFAYLGLGWVGLSQLIMDTQNLQNLCFANS